MTADHADAPGEHYARADLGAAIVAALRTAGKNPDALAVEDLAAVDQFHSRGREATRALARLAALSPEMRVLDIGGGIGGPARTLAQEVGCRVDVVETMAQYCTVGEDLTARTGLAARVAFHRADALALPFADGLFDAAWMQHSSMNIEDKRRLFEEIRRVLRPGGRLAMHEVMAGTRSPIHFPVPWARDPSMSFLPPADEFRETVRSVGFQELAWVDASAESLEWFRPRAAALRARLPALGLHVVLGPAFPAMVTNVVWNLEEDRIAIVKAVWRRR